ncbi:tetratricopeptide repeat protein [Mycobacteroides abscessus]
MPIDISGRQIFLASPGDLAAERTLCRDVIRRFNEEHANESGVHFIVKGWEAVAPGVGRPQGKINPHIEDCDFMILILGHRWGSPPSIDGPYSSGTEEEFFRCLELLQAPDAAMRDLAVIFKTIEPDRLQDAGPQLEAVIDFRSRLEQSKELLYTVFDSDFTLTTAINKALKAWSERLAERTPRIITLPEKITGDVEPKQRSGADLLDVAAAFIEKQLWMQAEKAFALAIADGSPIAITKYANFMRRTGRSHTAMELNEQLLDDPVLLSNSDPESVGFRVNSLTSMGLMHRYRGNLEKSAALISEAISTALSSPEPVNRELCKAYDNYGHTLLRQGKNDEAVDSFEKAHSIRKESGTPAEITQSVINIGRSLMAAGRYKDADERFSEVLTQLEDESADQHLRANALAGAAEAKLRQGITDGVRLLVDECIAINEAINNLDGHSIGLGLSARLLLLEGNIDEANTQAEQALKDSSTSNNVIGMATATWLQAEVAFARNDVGRCKELVAAANTLERQSRSESVAADIATTYAKLSA